MWTLLQITWNSSFPHSLIMIQTLSSILINFILIANPGKISHNLN